MVPSDAVELLSKIIKHFRRCQFLCRQTYEVLLCVMPWTRKSGKTKAHGKALRRKVSFSSAANSKTLTIRSICDSEIQYVVLFLIIR